MKRAYLAFLVAAALTVVLVVPSCWAKDNGYCYIVSYSLSEKTVYITPVFVAKVSGATYSDEEFVADVKLIRKMEGQFQKYMAAQGANSTDYITSARVAYRTQSIAEKRLADEKNNFANRGFTINEAGNFRFKD